MKKNENGEIILNEREAYYIASMIDDLVTFCNGNDEDDKEGMYIKKGYWITPKTCYQMKELLKIMEVPYFGLSINTLADLSK